MELHTLTLKQARDGLRNKDFSSVELVSSCLDQIKKFNPKINAFITVCHEQALEEAKQADIKQLFMNQPLFGIPMAIKDNFCTKGVRTTAGSKVLEDYVPVYDATVVKRLKEAGAIIIGKTNLDAWAHGSSGENSDFGPTRNPWCFDYVPGGSSSGSVASVSSLMIPAATGSDTGGSIRLPASFCNLVGLKPTYGRVPRTGVVAMASSLDSIGHLTRTVEDSAIILSVTAGQDGFDATSLPALVPDYTKNLKKGVRGVKIGLPKEYFSEGLDPTVKEKTMAAIKTLEDLGAKMIDVSLPSTEYAVAAYYLIMSSEVSSNLARYDGIRYGFGREKFGDEARRRIMLGTYALSSGYYDQYYAKVQKVRTLIINDFKKAFEECNCLIAPVSPSLPFKLGEKIDDPLSMYLSDILTVTANLAGLPALSVPAGFVHRERVELPVGLQFLGPQLSEELLFQVGFALEQENDYYQQKPELI
ncbi:MAG: Asp-tRNA(Asn)/Glu-tRNA(Gln) amidotransferase subunit GatA [bacterium]|nr:Asp-tRNA(Asn)/Glu-tRNA(Gln) amidotransferase subunit GatA [bacterium]